MGTVVFETARALAALGHEVEVFTPQYYEEKEIKGKDEPVEPIHSEPLQEQIDYATRLEPSFSYGNAARLTQLQDELNEFDLVHLHYPFFGTANVVRKWKLRNPKKPLVITYHMDTRAPGWKGLLFKYYAAYWMPKILTSADLLLTSSLDYLRASDAGRLYEQTKEKWRELPFGVDLERFAPREKPEEIFQQHELSSDVPTILFVGGMDNAHYFKGVPVLLEAIQATKASGFDMQALLVGDGDLRTTLEQKALFLGISDRVRFVGHVSDEELPRYYNAADLLVLPSINRGEAFGMVLLEAIASGVPVVATDIPGVRTVVREVGTVVPPNNVRALAEAMIGYFDPTNNRTEWGRGVRRMAEEVYSWEQIGQELDIFYRDLL